jgi:hypothetical protein
VYAASGGGVVEKYWNRNAGWSGWGDLGGGGSATPAVVYNPTNRNIEVYGSVDGILVEKFWSASYGWSGWNGLS